ncbi:MAG: cysteine desulfurase-like protein [Gemmatimonadales bacterium]|nr:cysteine desulfurase-like protein [Gemmatimonadales bacterium]
MLLNLVFALDWRCPEWKTRNSAWIRMLQPLSTAAPALDVEKFRSAFRALDRRHLGKPVAYFDGPGGTQVPEPVVEAMSDYLRFHNANSHWAFPTSVETDRILDEARSAAADLLGCDVGEVAFGANMTTLTFHLARALGRRWGPGDEIVVTELDHHANLAPWTALERERGLTVKSVPLNADRTGLDMAAWARVLGPKTRLVAVGAASNAIGTRSDVAAIAAMARSVGALVFVDAVHLTPHVLPDVRALGCDFLACSAYKFCGPHVGILFGRADRLAELDVPKLAPAPDVGAPRLETGTQNHEGIAGVAAAIDFLAGFGGSGVGLGRRAALAAYYERLARHEGRLFVRLWDGLASIPGVRLHGLPPGGSRTATVAFEIDGVPARDAAVALAGSACFVSHGDFYATTLVGRLTGGRPLLRAGCAPYTTLDEVERLVTAVERLAEARSLLRAPS